MRKLRYFVAVAEQQHFGRAADQLYIAQPVLSRQIRSLEQDLGFALFERTTRSVHLTAAGEQLLSEAVVVLASVDAALRRVREASRGVERLVVAFSPGMGVSKPIRAFNAQYPNVEVDLLQLKWWEQDAPLRDGRADVGYLRRPFDDTGLRVIPIGRDRMVACLPDSHRLARRRTLRMADLDGENILDQPARRTSSIEEKFELIAVGHSIGLMPRGIAAAYSRPEFAYVPVTDAEPVETCLAVAKSRRERRIRDFLRLATASLQARPLAAVD